MSEQRRVEHRRVFHVGDVRGRFDDHAFCAGHRRGHLLRAFGRCGGILAAGHEQARHGNSRQPLAVVMALQRPGAAGIAVHGGLADHAAHPVQHRLARGVRPERRGEPALDGRFDQRLHPLLAGHRHTADPGLDVVGRRPGAGVAGRQAQQASGMQDRHAEPGHAAERQADEMRLLHAHMIHQGDGVIDQHLEAVRPRRRPGLAVTAGVVAQDAVAVPQRDDLRVPHGDVGGQGIREHDPGRVRTALRGTIEFIAEGDAVQVNIHGRNRVPGPKGVDPSLTARRGAN